MTKKQNFSFFFSSTGEEKGHKSFTFKVIPPVRMSLWILYQKPTGRNRVGKSLPIMFSIVRTAGASPAELTNGNHIFGSSQNLLHLAQVRMHPAHP